MTAVMARRTATLAAAAALVGQVRVKPTHELEDLYRAVREMDAGDLLGPWRDVETETARELRVRIAASWLHRHWCAVETCDNAQAHLGALADSARRIVADFETADVVAEAVYAGLWPDTPIVASHMTYLVTCEAFGELLAGLVSVVPAETEATR